MLTEFVSFGTSRRNVRRLCLRERKIIDYRYGYFKEKDRTRCRESERGRNRVRHLFI